MSISDVIAMVLTVLLVAIVPPIAMVRTLRRVPFSSLLQKGADSSSRRLEKYRRASVVPVAFPRWYRMLPIFAVIDVLVLVIGVPGIVLVAFGKVFPTLFPQAIAVLPAGTEYGAVAMSFLLMIFLVLLAEPVLMRIFPRMMTYLSALSLVNNPLVRTGKGSKGSQHSTLERIAGSFDLRGYSGEYLKARGVGLVSALLLSAMMIGIGTQQVLVVNHRGLEFRHLVTADTLWEWSEIEQVVIDSTVAGDDGVAPAFLVQTVSGAERDIWGIDSLTRVGDELIALCQEAHRRNIPVLIGADADRVLRLPLTAADNARVLDACATR